MKVFCNIYIGLCCAFLQLACGTPHDDSELTAIFDNKDTLLRAIPVSADQVSFEVCFVSKEGETIKVKENTCTPAFISEQNTSIAFNEEELSQGLAGEDAKLIQQIKDAHIQAKKDNFIFGAVFVGAAATAVILREAGTKGVYKIKRVVVKAIHSMTNISLKRLMSSNALSLVISLSVAAALVAGGSSIISLSVNTLDNSTKNLDNIANENSEELLSAASEHYYNLHAAVETLHKSTTDNPPDLNLAFSTDQLLHDLGTYFKHTMPSKNIHAYCHPAASLEQRHCSTL